MGEHRLVGLEDRRILVGVAVVLLGDRRQRVAARHGVELRLGFGTRHRQAVLDLGHASEELDVEYDGKAMSIGFNARYVIDLLNEIDSNDVRIELNGELDPGVIRPVDENARPGNNYLGVVMPMRL